MGYNLYIPETEIGGVYYSLARTHVIAAHNAEQQNFVQCVGQKIGALVNLGRIFGAAPSNGIQDFLKEYPETPTNDISWGHSFDIGRLLHTKLVAYGRAYLTKGGEGSVPIIEGLHFTDSFLTRVHWSFKPEIFPGFDEALAKDLHETIKADPLANELYALRAEGGSVLLTPDKSLKLERKVATRERAKVVGGTLAGIQE
ncbi:hypothetical protein HYU14_05355 [Candidatus Woesearchaeota archaeon]|nr:hypothetical protein [Candidatus Woesearchaeota archaeon]